MRTKWTVVALALVLCATVAMAAAPKFNLGGRTITISTYNDLSGYFKDGNGRGRIELVEKMFNCKVVLAPLLPWDGGPEKIITSVAAGTPEGDMFLINNRWIPQLASAGAIMAMDKVLDNAYYKTLPPPHDKMRETYSSYKGKTWAACLKGSTDRNIDMGSGQGWFYNRDMVKAAGLETPNDLQKKNQWTWDKMREYAKKLTKDTTGDGTIDVWGTCLRLDPWPIDTEMAVYSNGGALLRYTGGKYVFALNEAQGIQALQLMRDMVNVDKSVLVGDKANNREEFVAGRVAMIRNDLFAIPADAPNLKFDWGWVFFPKGPRGQYVNPVWGMDIVVLPVGEKDPRAVVEVASALFEVTADYRDLTKYTNDILGNFTAFVKDKSSLDTIAQMLAKPRLWDYIANDAKQHDLIDKAMVDSVFGPKSPKAVVDEIAPQVQAVIDDSLNKK